MKTVLTIAFYTLSQQARSRLHLVVVLFGFMMTAVSLLFGAVAADQELVVVWDVGLAATELFGLAAALFGAVGLILDETESRSVYLVLARPFPRWMYVLGRFLGLVAAVSAGILLMGAFLCSLLLLRGWTPEAAFFLAFPFMIFKVTIVIALALFFSLFSTSGPVSVVFTVFFWLLGHFTEELGFIAEKTGSALAGVGLKVFLLVVPDLSLLNYRDVFGVPGLSEGIRFFPGMLHVFFYTTACLALSAALFSRKEC